MQPENAPMRAAFIGAGGLLGYMMGAIRGRYVTISSHCTNRVRDIYSRTEDKENQGEMATWCELHAKAR